MVVAPRDAAVARAARLITVHARALGAPRDVVTFGCARAWRPGSAIAFMAELDTPSPTIDGK